MSTRIQEEQRTVTIFTATPNVMPRFESQFPPKEFTSRELAEEYVMASEMACGIYENCNESGSLESCVAIANYVVRNFHVVPHFYARSKS